VEKIRIWRQWYFHQLLGAGFVGGTFGRHTGTSYYTLHWEQIQLGAQLGGMDFHRSQQSTTSSKQQSTSRQSRATYFQAYGDMLSVITGGFTSLLLVLDQFLSVTQTKQSTVMLQIVFVRQPFQASLKINHCLSVRSF
jgi:hypothetical protein